MGIFSNIKKLFDKNDDKEVKVYEEGLTKSRDSFVNSLGILGIKYTKIDDRLFDELEEILIMSDLGVNTSLDLVSKLRKRVKDEKIEDFEFLKEVIVDELMLIYVGDNILSSKINVNEDGKSIVLFVGVNGVGKTTSIAKLASKMKAEGKSVMLIAADTFRAGAVLQLEEWSKRVGVMFYGKETSDPASVVYDGLKHAVDNNVDVVLIDTAGRLHNKVNLMKELEKINNVIKKVVESGSTDTLLVVDASTGQNGIVQAEQFKEIVNLTGVILTKLDGTAKGGIVIAIKEVVDIPVKFIGFGEKESDFLPFDIEKYIYGLFKDWK